MRTVLSAALALTLLAAPSHAQTDAPPSDAGEETLDGLSELEAQARAALEALGRELGASLSELRTAVEDLAGYGAPRILPNGDILIPRRRPPEDAPAPGDRIDL